MKFFSKQSGSYLVRSTVTILPICLSIILIINQPVSSSGPSTQPPPSNHRNRANIYLIDHHHHQNQQLPSPVSIGTDELNALLSHNLGISDYETLPESLYPSEKKAQIIFGNHASDLPQLQPVPESERSNLMIIIYGINDSKIFSTRSIHQSLHLTLPNPPDSLSFDALISTYIARLINKRKVSIDSIYGIVDFIRAYSDGIGGEVLDNLKSWVDDWEGDLKEWFDWSERNLVKIDTTATDNVKGEMMLKEDYSKWLNHYGNLDSSALKFLEDLKNLDKFTEAFQSSKSKPKLNFLRLSGLQQIQRQHGDHSPQYRLAYETLQRFLEASLSILPTDPNLSKIFITVPTQPVHTRLGRRMSISLLSPFKTSELSFVRRDLIQRRRSVFGDIQKDGGSLPIVASSRECYKDQMSCEKATDGCNGHGDCLEGQKTSGGKCFVCSCKKSKDQQGRLVYWSGETCQKLDVSTGFILLSSTGIGLVVLIGFSIWLLVSIGAEGLPQQLASVQWIQ
ncbi:hypothetical protein PPACK8108_LOCUS4777 [Phakopsora pachyrhizi]|uniref:Vacuolar sorting protein Vps3844 C-terminal domain-containing protein n=1 Tax=Phakopsora pachyrhizi TaxID=170000 RepID=A0AAV0APG0_PHAPC|nr:hypothetical protein PPACK8108_LOCUS4777 [Phakopsora pachyrhizi]